MANPPPMLPGLGFPVDSEIDLLRKWTWNTWLWAQEDFQPEDIPGLGLDLDASYGVLNSIGPDVPATNGQRVRRWLDKSGNGRYHDQTISNLQPIFLSAGFNNLPCLSFDGFDDSLMGLIGLDLLANRPGATVCAVAVGNSGTVSSREAVWFGSTNNSTFVRVLLERSSGNQYSLLARRNDADSLQNISGGVTGDSAFILSGVVNWVGASAALYLDGSIIGAASPFLTPGLSSNVNSAEFQAGRLGTSLAFPGKIARILVWPRALTPEELGKIHTYLSQTYGIPLAP